MTLTENRPVEFSQFVRLSDFINEMNSSNSTNHKVEILKKYSGDDFIKKVLLYTYHPYKQYFVTSANLKKRKDITSTNTLETKDLFYLLDALDSRKITGHDALASVNKFIDKYHLFSDIIYQILDRNLETRATTTLINRVFPNLIPTFNVALAFDATKVKNVNLTSGEWLVSRKLDGVRCLAIIREPGNIKFFSRNGKEFDTLGVVKDEIVRLGLTNCVLDGEICMMKEDGSDDFQGILKQIQRKDHTIAKPKYWVFDILTIEEFESGTGTVKLSERIERNIGQATNTSSIISILPQSRIKSEEELTYFRTTSKELGWEGLIARKDVGYEGDRTRNMLKLKEFYDAEYEVKEVIMGPQRVVVNERETTEEVLSAVIIEHKGNPVQVGSGFTIDERREYFKHPERILNQMITVQYFEETVDQTGKNSLRFPVFKWNHGKVRST